MTRKLGRRTNPMGFPPPPLPHSWAIKDWPPYVFPGSPARGNYLVRAQYKKLLRAGALVRVGRTRVIIGERYNSWLKKCVSNMQGYEVICGRVPIPQHLLDSGQRLSAELKSKSPRD